MISNFIRGSTVIVFVVFGFTFNLSVILVVAAKRRLHKMHFFLLANLSMSDLLLHILATLVAVSQFKTQWVFGMAWCEKTLYLLRCALTTTKILLCAVTWECHTAVVTPYSFSSDITLKKITAVVLSWIGGFLITAVPFFGMGRIVYNEVTHTCEHVYLKENKIGRLFLSTLLLFFIPFGLIAKQQYQIHRAIRRQKIQIAQQQKAINANIDESQQRKMLMKSFKESKDALIIVIGFLVSYLPLFVTINLRANLQENDTLYNAWFLAVTLSQAGSTWNPIIYCFRKREFRQQLFK